MAASTTYLRFVQFLNVLNAALEARPREWLADFADSLEGRNFGVAIYDSDPDLPYDFYTIRLRNGVFVLASHSVRQHEVAWHLSRRVLERTVANARYHVDTPGSIDLDWLKRLVGKSAASPASGSSTRATPGRVS